MNLVYSQRNRSAAVRIPVYSLKPAAKRVEFRCPDPSANPYLAFAALLLAGMDGITRRLDPGAPVDKDLYDLPPEELAKVPSVPGSLEEALDALEADHDFLLAGGVFTEELIEDWVSYKRRNEVDAVRLRPHPWEFRCTTTSSLPLPPRAGPAGPALPRGVCLALSPPSGGSAEAWRGEGGL